MTLRRIKTCMFMSLREILRNRLALLLLFIIPSLFYGLTLLTISEEEIAFRLAVVAQETFVQVSQRREALLFIGLAAVGLISSFLGLTLSQRDAAASQRLVLCGYRWSEIIVAKLAVLLLVIAVVAAYVGALLNILFVPRHPAGMILGFALGGFIYGCYGMFIGVVVKRELEGILFVVLLTNIDIGWLQNPVYYADAQNQAIIRALPAFFPSQASMVSAFTDYGTALSLLFGCLYGGVFLVCAIVIAHVRLRVRRTAGAALGASGAGELPAGG